MKIITSVVLVIFILYIQVAETERTQEASYQCLKVDNVLIASFRLIPNNDTVYQIIGQTADESNPDDSQSVSTCALPVTEDQGLYILNISINLDTDSASPSCGMSVVISGRTYKFRMRTQAVEGMTSSTDAYYDFTCDAQASLLAWMRFESFAVGSTSTVELQPFVPGLSVWIMDGRTNTALYGEVELGRQIYYQIGFQKCFDQDTMYDSCGTEFMTAFHSFSNPDNAENTLFFINPSPLSVSIRVESMGLSLSCSPVVVGPRSFGTCHINSSYEVTETSNKRIHVISPHQCIYLQQQYSDQQRYFTFPVLPTDVTGSKYFLTYDQTTDIIVISSDSSVLSMGEMTGTTSTVNLGSNETYYKSLQSINDPGFLISSSDKISVFTKGTLQNGFYVEQTFPETFAGKHFIVPNIAYLTLRCVCFTDSTQINNDRTVNSCNNGGTITGTAYTLTEIIATQPVTCQLFDDVTSFSLIPTEQQSNAYSIVVDKALATYDICISIKSSEKSNLGLTVDGNQQSLASAAWLTVEGTVDSEGTVFPIDLTGTSGYVLITLYHPTTSFQAVLKSTHIASNNVSISYIPGFVATELNPEQACASSIGFIGDLVDNDCDGFFDEDVVEPEATQTDMKGWNPEKVCYDKIKIVHCDISPDAIVGNVTKRIISDGCVVGAAGDPLRPSSSFMLDSTNSDQTMALYKTGTTELVGFDGFSQLHLKCQVKLCFLHDSSCDTSSCSSRRKREAVENTGDLITIDDIKPSVSNQGSCLDDTVFVPVVTVLSTAVCLLLCIIVYTLVKTHWIESRRQSTLELTNMAFH